MSTRRRSANPASTGSSAGLDETGVVESVLPLRSTTFARYDTKLMEGIWQWRYSPYLVDDQPVPVCTGITFIYSQR